MIFKNDEVEGTEPLKFREANVSLCHLNLEKWKLTIAGRNLFSQPQIQTNKQQKRSTQTKPPEKSSTPFTECSPHAKEELSSFHIHRYHEG